MTLLNVHGVHKVKQIKIYAVKPLVLQPVSSEAASAVKNLKKI
jgi:hypothetical protein